MDGYVNKLDYIDEEKVMEYCKNIIKAVEMTHEVVRKSKLRSKKANRVGNGSIILLHKVLNAMFNYAESEDMVRRNYAKGCTKELGIYNNKREALTIEQQGDFVEFVEHS